MFSDFTSFWATPRRLRLLRSDISGFRADNETFLAAFYRHKPQLQRVFLDGMELNSRGAALVGAGMSMSGIIHLLGFIVSGMRNTAKVGWRDVAEHALRYWLHHAQARQVARSLPTLNPSFEGLTDDVDG